MARTIAFVVELLAVASICDAVISESRRSAALELFSPTAGSFSRLEEAYEALRTFEVLGIEKKPDIKDRTCNSVVDTLSSSSSNSKDLYYALRVNELLKCKISKEALTDQSSEVDVFLGNVDGILRAIKALSQSDGRWRYSSKNPETSTYAAALETLSGVISLADSAIDENLIGTLKNDIVKLFDSIEKYDDGAYYFDDKLIDASGHQGPLSATSSVVRGLTTFASASGSLNIPEDKILGLARFLLGIGVPGNSKDLYYQIDALSCLENNRVLIPLILSLPATLLSLTSKDKLKVRVNGSTAPPLSVKLMQVFSSGSKDASVLKQELNFDPKEAIYTMDALPEGVDVAFEIVLSDTEHKRKFATGGRTKVPIHVTGVVKVDNAKVAVLEGDMVECEKKLDLPGKNDVALSANHLQKLHLSFLLTTPFGKPLNPYQALLKLRHETGVEHIFVVGNSGKQFEITLDFLEYDIELTVCDAVMENSFLQPLGCVELDLPKAPEKATHPPPQVVNPCLRYGPKAEITHIIRAPEKRPPEEVFFAFSDLVLVPFLAFLVGLLCPGVNLKNFLTSAVPATFAILFHNVIVTVFLLCLLFWSKIRRPYHRLLAFALPHRTGRPHYRQRGRCTCRPLLP